MFGNKFYKRKQSKDKNMRILLLSFYYEPDLSAGSFRSTALVEALKNNYPDIELEVMTTMPNRYSSFNDEAFAFEENNNIKINRINLGKHKGGFVDQSILFIKFAVQIIRLVRKREKYNIVYSTSSRLMTAFLGALIANRQKSKLFLDLRDIFTDTLESLFEKSKFKYLIPIFRKIEHYTVNSASQINLVSRGFEDYFRNINNTVKYSFYSNGIDEVFLNYNFAKKENSPKKIITYAGNIGEGQGLEKIVSGLSSVVADAYEIHIIGDGGRKSQLLESIKGIENIKIFNPVNRDELLKIYKNSDILFLHLNDYKAFEKVLPSKVFEYAATNKFIIAGVNGYAKEFIEQNITDSMVFKPCSVEDFEEKFSQLNKNIAIDRREFVEKFSRKNIMLRLSKEVYSL